MGGLCDGQPRCPSPEVHVLGDRQVVVEAGGVAQEGDPPANRPTFMDEIVAEYLDGPRLGSHQAGTEAQQGGLAGPVRPPEQHDLAGFHGEVDPGEGREVPEQRHRSS